MGVPRFNCSRPISLPPPQSVHQLQPSNIEVIAALGDSLSVGQAEKATSGLDIFEKFPGSSFVTGNSVQIRDQATLFNIFNEFSPSLKGGSSDHIQKFYDFNFAVPGSFSSDLPRQAQELSDTLKRKLGDENQKTWKLVNIFSGNNDLCKICQNQTLYGPESYGKSLRTALGILQSSVPNVFVNLMTPVNVQIMTETHNISKFCDTFHRLACPCIFDLDKLQYQTIKEQFDAELKSVAEEFSNNSTTFTVVVAPTLNIPSIPHLGNQVNIGLLALDCFHVSPAAHDIVAKQVWKGLFEKVGEKTALNPLSMGLDAFVCPPVECPFLRTVGNSDNCEPVTEYKILQLAPYGVAQPALESSFSVFTMMGLMLFGSTLVLLFVRASFRRSSEDFSAERRHLLPPKRVDLNDYIF
uniref:Uncharacterized protein n=1 Tax=Caenorhabditis japonica TaxID=281687 RepID=A0A8R1DKY7_CAEJA